MKRQISFIAFTILLIAGYSFPQDLTIFDCIGKKQNDITKVYGKPVYVDNSMPSMTCIFYKTPDMVFVINETGIFQVDIKKNYSTESELRKDLEKCIQKCVSKGFKVDTLSVTNITLSKPGVFADVNIIAQNNKYELRVEAKRRE